MTTTMTNFAKIALAAREASKRLPGCEIGNIEDLGEDGISIEVNGFWFIVVPYTAVESHRSILGIREKEVHLWSVIPLDEEGEEQTIELIDEIRYTDEVILEAYLYGLRHQFYNQMRADALYEAYVEDKNQ